MGEDSRHRGGSESWTRTTDAVVASLPQVHSCNQIYWCCVRMAVVVDLENEPQVARAVGLGPTLLRQLKQFLACSCVRSMRALAQRVSACGHTGW